MSRFDYDSRDREGMFEYTILFASPLSVPATQALVDAHGGRIVDFDEEDGGHQYAVTFPRSGDPHHDASAFLTALYGEPTDADDYSNSFDDSDMSPAGPVG